MNVWDTFTHQGGHVVNNETGDIACDSYHKYKEDVQLMKAVGVSNWIVYLITSLSAVEN